MITLLNPQLDSTYADVWGEFLPFALQSWAPIIEAGCFVPRWYQLPINSLEQMTAGEYDSWSLQLPPGSFILEILRCRIEETPEDCDAPTVVLGAFSVQITDTQLDYTWFSQPIPDRFFYKHGGTGRNGHVLPKPYPVVNPGKFQFERWCTVTGRCEIVMAIAAPENVA